MARTLTRIVVALLAGSALSFAAAHVDAQDNALTEVPDPHAAVRRPIAIDVGVGPAVGLDPGAPTAVQLRESFAYHFSETDEGFHVGAALGQVFVPDNFLFEIGARVGWDVKFAIDRHVALGLDPYLTLGVGLYSGPNGPRTPAAFQLAPGVDLKLFLGDTAYVFVRPLAFDFEIRDRTAAYYDLLFGLGGRF